MLCRYALCGLFNGIADSNLNETVAFKQEMLCVDFESDVEDDILAIFRKGEVCIYFITFEILMFDVIFLILSFFINPRPFREFS